VSSDAGLFVTAFGMVTPVGFSGPASCAAMRAGVRQVLETNLWDSTTGQYLCAGKVRLPQSWTGTERLAELVSPAIHECFAAASDPPERIPLIICVSALSRLGRPSDNSRSSGETVEGFVASLIWCHCTRSGIRCISPSTRS
jgi:3-oxoacyl-[acyl-carrier-protein] synthase-1